MRYFLFVAVLISSERIPVDLIETALISPLEVRFLVTVRFSAVVIPFRFTSPLKSFVPVKVLFPLADTSPLAVDDKTPSSVIDKFSPIFTPPKVSALAIGNSPEEPPFTVNSVKEFSAF